jgi:hypothetical protein
MFRLFGFGVLLVIVLGMSVRAGEPTSKGEYVLQGIDKTNVSDSNLKASDGLSIRFRWSSVDKGSTWNWSYVDSQVQRAKKLGKPYMLRMMAGKHHPAWLGDKVVPWDTTAQNALKQAIQRMGERYSGDPSLHLVHLSSTANDASAEMHIADWVLKHRDYSDAKMITAWTRAIDAYRSAFPNTALALNASMEPNSKGAITFPVVAYCQSTLGNRATFQHNSLKADTSLTAKHHQLILDLGRQGWRTGFQAVGTGDRFGNYKTALNKAGPDWDYLELYQNEI